MKKAKKIAFVAMMGLLLFGCGKKKDTTTKPGDTTKNVTTKSTTKEKAKTVVLVYSVGEGSIPGGSLGKEIEYGKDFTLDVPVWTGHTFNGWYVLEKTINKVMLTDGKGKSLKPFDLDSSSETITIIADYVPEVDTVTFDTCGGSNIDSQQVAYDSYAKEPTEEPTKEGHSFNGWYTAAEGGKEWDFEKNLIHGDTTIYAQWSIDRYDYYFKNGNSDAGTISCNLSSLQNKADYGTEVILTVEEASGWSFIGWYDTDAEKFVSDKLEYKFTIPAHSICYEAMFDSFDLTTEVYGNGSCTVYDGSSITAGTKVELEATPATGHHFVGWFIGETLISDKASYEYAMPKESVTITAKFEINVHTITLSKAIDPEVTGDYGTVTQSNEDGKYEYGELVTLTATPIDGYSFSGWYDNDNKNYISITSGVPFEMFDRDLNLTAMFTYYEVTISKDILKDTTEEYGTVKIDDEEITSKKISNGNTFTLVATPIEGYSFVGWYDNNSDEYIDTSSTTTLTIDYSGYDICAVFTYYTVTITLRDGDSNYGEITSGECENVKVSKGEAISATAAYTQGSTVFEFLGWFNTTDEDADPVFTDLTLNTTVTDDTYLEARFAPRKFKIYYDLDGGTNNESNPGYISYTDSLPITLLDPTKTGYTFNGWTDENGYTATQITVLSAHSYYANWSVNEYTVTINIAKHKMSDNSTISFGGYKYQVEDGSYSTESYSTELYKSVKINYAEWLYIDLIPYLGRSVSADKITSGQVTLNGYILNGQTVYNLRYLFDKNISITIDFNDNDGSSLKYFDFKSDKTTCEILNFKAGMETYASSETKLYIPRFVTKIADGCVKGFSNLEALEIPFTGNYYGATGAAALFSYIFPTNTYTNAVLVNQHIYSGSLVVVGTNRYIPNSLTRVTLCPSANYRIPECAFSFANDKYPTNLTNVDFNFNTGYGFLGIERYAFYGFKSLYSFGLMNTGNCEIQYLPENFTLGDYAFAMTSVESLYMNTKNNHDKITFGKGIFDGCANMKSFDIPFVGKNINCTDTYDEQYTFAYTFFGATNGGSNAIKANYPTEITKNESTGVMNDKFDKDTNIVYMPKELSIRIDHTGNIPVAAFDLRCYSGSSANNFTANYSIRLYGVSNNYSSIKVNDFAFTGLEYTLFSIYIQENITSIGYGAFKMCYCYYANYSGIDSTSLYYFKNLEYIGKYAFYNVIMNWSKARLENMGKTLNTSISFTDNKATSLYIDDNAFFGCNLISSFSVTTNITYIGKDAFYYGDTSSLTKINYDGTIASWNSKVVNFSSNWREISGSININVVRINSTDYTMDSEGKINQ